MKKSRLRILVFWILLIFNGQIYAQEIQELKLPKLKKSYYLITHDSTSIRLYLVDKVTSNFGFFDYGSTNYSKTYKGISGISGVHFTTFSNHPFLTKIDSDFKIDENIVYIKPDEKIYIYGFTTVLNEGNRVNKNYSKLLMSAYLQEFKNDYSNDQDNFTPLVIKDKSEFWKRNWINIGYGMSYLAKDNPFMGGKAFAVCFFYVWEALHYIPIFGGPFFGETTEDKIVIPIVGISSLIISKGIFGGLIIGNRYLKINKSIHNSGYRIPSNLKY